MFLRSQHRPRISSQASRTKLEPAMPATIRQPDPLCAYQDAWVGSKNPPRKKRSAGHNHSAGPRCLAMKANFTPTTLTSRVLRLRSARQPHPSKVSAGHPSTRGSKHNLAKRLSNWPYRAGLSRLPIDAPNPSWSSLRLVAWPFTPARYGLSRRNKGWLACPRQVRKSATR
jgi:hypothetical protein